MINSRFTIALHVLCLLASGKGQPLTSELIAGSVNTHPVVIRRLLAAFRNAGMVRSRGGGSGGWELVQEPAAVSLLQVYRLLHPGSVFALHKSPPNPRCRVGRNIQQGLHRHYQRAQEGMERELAAISLADVLADVTPAQCS